MGPEQFAAAPYLPEAVAFALRPAAEALVLEPAGGLGVLQALAGGAAQVTAVVDNPLERVAVAAVAPEEDVYADPRVRVVFESGRVFTQQDKNRYQVVFLPLTDAYQPVTSGAYSLAETYNLTVEAFAGILDRLAPDGILVVTRWLQMPPSEEIRLLSTLVAALERQGSKQPGQKLVALRGIQTITALVRPGGWTASRAGADSRLCRGQAVRPGMGARYPGRRDQPVQPPGGVRILPGAARTVRLGGSAPVLCGVSLRHCPGHGRSPVFLSFLQVAADAAGSCDAGAHLATFRRERLFPALCPPGAGPLLEPDPDRRAPASTWPFPPDWRGCQEAAPRAGRALFRPVGAGVSLRRNPADPAVDPVGWPPKLRVRRSRNHPAGLLQCREPGSGRCVDAATGRPGRAGAVGRGDAVWVGMAHPNLDRLVAHGPWAWRRSAWRRWPF